jgi:hypothetical protein
MDEERLGAERVSAGSAAGGNVTDDFGAEAKSGMYRRAGYAPVDFDRFHTEELPSKLREGASDRVHWDVAGAAPIAIVLPGDRAYSFVSRDDRVEVVPGIVQDAETVVAMSEEAWIDYRYEMRTRIGLLYSNAVEFRRGSFETWDRWAPALRCLYSDREIYDPRHLDFRDLEGKPLDLHRRFTLADDREEMSNFLRQTGYLVVKQVFDPELIATLSGELDRVRDAAVEGELTSWWADDGCGGRIPYRLTYLNEQSPRFAALYDHPRVVELRALAREEVVPVPDRIEGILAVLKEFSPNADVSAFANLPFHNDCGMGGCHITCPCVLVGIQLDAQGPGSSQLHMMAGSWGKAFHPFPSEKDRKSLPIIALETEPGDATVHIGCGLHAGPGPTGPGMRRTIYVQHYSSRAAELIGHHAGYNQIMPGYGVGNIPNFDELQGA